MKTKLIAGLTGATLLAMAPLAFAQSVVPTSGTGSTSAYTSPSTNTTGTGTTGSTSTTGAAATTGTTGTTSTTPGVPNTGAGGEAPANIALLVASGLIALGGAYYLARQRALA